MNNILKQIIWGTLALLISSNIYICISGMKIADEINYFEQQTKETHKNNLNLEKGLSLYDSYQYAASKAAELNFVKKTTPIYLENLKYALNR